MKAIFKREISAYFTTMLGYIFMAVFLLLTGLYFVMSNIANGDGTMSAMIGSFASLLFLLIPILTMRLMSEDRRQKTDQLLLTSPVSLTKIVVGKFLAAWSMFIVTSAVTLTYIIILYVYGNPYVVEILLAYIGLWLLGGAMIAVGQFISALTEHQFISALITLIALFLLQSMDSFTASIQSQWVSGILNFFAPLIYFDNLIFNVFSPSSIIYFILFISLFLFLTIQVMDGKRYGKR